MDFRYNGVFGPPGAVPELPSPSGSGWGSPNKRGSRSGLPNNWFDAAPQLDPTPTSPFEAYRPSTSSPGLSPPASTSSGPTTSASSSHFPAYQVPPHPYSTSAQPMYQLDQSYPNGLGAEIGMAPSPPPQFLPYGLGGMNGLGAMGNGPSMQNMNPYASNGLSGYPAPSLAALPGAQRNGVQAGLWRHPYSPAPTPDDDVIPTAIVIKNIPFSVPRETLLSVIESLGAPLPYAFNYHHDSGVFRGLAFANFRAPDEAASVVAALNGYDVQGRKLRVEYKKVLQPGEKDRIEREKALKRMKSIQFNDPNSQHARDSRSMPPPPVPPIHLAPSRASNTSPDYGSAAEYSPPHSATSTTSDTLPLTLDLNDPVALDIYSRVLVFKEDRMRDELAFSKSLAPMERRIVHLVAQKLGLTSLTKGEGMGKYVLVTREGVPRPPLTSSLSNSSHYLSPYASGLGVHTEPSGNSGGALRIKKSMPDLRGFHGPAAGRDPARSLTSQRSSGNLRDSRDLGAVGGRRANGANGTSYGSSTFNSLFGSSIGEIPPVPPIPAGLTVPNSAKSNGHSFGAHSPDGSDHATSPGIGSGPHGSQPLRNPRGPAGESRGFGAGSGAAAGTLRTSVSHGVMRGGSGFSAGGGGGGGHGFGRSSRVVDEDDVGEILALSAGMDALRTKDSLDL